MARCLARCRLHVICTLHVACDMHVAGCIVCCTLHVALYALIGKDWSECGLFAVFAALSPKARQSVGCRRRRSRRRRDNGRTRSAQSSRRSRHATCNTQQHATCNMQHATRSAPTQARDVAAAASRVAAADWCRPTALSILSMLRRRRLHVAPHLARSIQPPVGARSELGRSLAGRSVQRCGAAVSVACACLLPQELGDVQRQAEANLRSAQTTLHGAAPPPRHRYAKALQPSHRSLF